MSERNRSSSERELSPAGIHWLASKADRV